MSQSKGLLSILCLVLAYSCAQAWNFAFETEEWDDNKVELSELVVVADTCGQPLGGGSLVSKHAVLTAWEFVENRNASLMTVLIGDSPWNAEKLRVRSIVRHPNFSRKTGAYNLALLFLKKPIEFTSKIAPINLATQTSIRNLDLTSCRVKSLSMMTLPLPVVSTATCQQELQRWLGAAFRLDDSLICAGGGIGRNVCDQDGYPLVCPLARDPKQFQQVGIVNWHINCGAAGTPDVYTNVAKLNDWINQQVALNPYVDGPVDEDNAETECSPSDFSESEFGITFEEKDPKGSPSFGGLSTNIRLM